MPLSPGWDPGISQSYPSLLSLESGGNLHPKFKGKFQGYHTPNPEFFGKYGNSKPYGKGASWLGMCFFWEINHLTSYPMILKHVVGSRSFHHDQVVTWLSLSLPGRFPRLLEIHPKHLESHNIPLKKTPVSSIKATKITQILRLEIPFSVQRFFKKFFWNKQHHTWESPFSLDSLEDNCNKQKHLPCQKNDGKKHPKTTPTTQDYTKNIWENTVSRM